MTDLRFWCIHDGGLSSWTLVWCLMPKFRDLVEGCCGSFGIGSYPHDPSDLNRCVQALNMIPDGRERLGLVSALFAPWKPFVDNWPELEALLAAEIAAGTGMAPRTYARMKELERD